jgi:flagellar basal-body rod modification protein FlgD
MTTTPPVNGSNVVVQPKGSQKQLGESDFLALMTAQLKQQDPFAPVDNQAMIAQMAQFSSLSGISEMNDTLKSIADQIGAQTELLTDIKAATAAPTPTTSSI